MVLAEVTLAAVEVVAVAATEVVDMAAVEEEASAAVETRCPSLVPVSSSKHGVSSVLQIFLDQNTDKRRHEHPPQIREVFLC